LYTQKAKGENMKRQNNNTKTVLAITASIVVFMMILSPTTVLPNVNGLPTRLPFAPFNDPRVPLQASVLENQISEDLKSHPGWIGQLSWNKTSAKIDYLGPPKVSPNFDLSQKSSHPKSDPQLVNDVDAIKGASGGGGTNGQTMQEIQSNYNLIQAPSAFNYIQLLNAFNSNSNDWLQVGTVYDNLGQFSSGIGWKVVFQAWTVGTSCGTPFVNTPSVVLNTWNNHDPIQSFIAGTSTPGQYSLSALDTLALLGSSTTISISGDTGTHTINLGQQGTPGVTCYYGNGAQIEEWSTGNTPYNFVSDSYDFQYTLPSGSTTTIDTGFDGLVQQIGSGVTVSPSDNPSSITYNCGSSSC
jgi:hypothetical protein